MEIPADGKGRVINIDESENYRVFLLALGTKRLRADLNGLEARISCLDIFLQNILENEA